MVKLDPAMIERLIAVTIEFQLQLTGRSPTAVNVVLSEELLVVTLHEALTPAEKALARSSGGAAKVQDLHRQLFRHSSQDLRRQIERITGRQVREAIAEVEPASGAVLHAFTTGTIVQVFSLAKRATEVNRSEEEHDRSANEAGQE
jgi:uncharacterized protein YbcI